jgi:hypothetical protein
MITGGRRLDEVLDERACRLIGYAVTKRKVKSGPRFQVISGQKENVMRSCLARLAAVRTLAALPILMLSLLALLVPLALNAAEPAHQGAAAAPPAQPAQPAQDTAQAKKAADMEAYMKLAQPGEHHKRLGSFAGKWKVTGKSWMEPGAPPTEFTGTMEASWMLGGRYLQSVHKSSFFGMPFEGHEIDGYDNATHEYFSTWMDTMGTGVMVFRGTCEDPCKALTETAEYFDPMAGKAVKTKSVTTWVDPDTYRYEMYTVGAAADGKDAKVMELVGKRDK